MHGRQAEITGFIDGYEGVVLDRTVRIDWKAVSSILTMGRYAGWLALDSGIAGGADIILIPEIPLRWESVFRASATVPGM